MTLLAARGLTRSYGGVRAVDGVDLAISRGEIRALIGPNGAGKSTLVGLITGRIVADAGDIRFEGRDITPLSVEQRVRSGIAYTFQITSIYPRLTVFDNVALAVQRKGAPIAAGTGAALARVGLADLAGEIAGTLSYGHQRLVEIAMGLALDPKLLILDEPTQGLAASEVAGFSDLVREIAAEATILLIEHNTELVMDLAHRITVLDAGKILAVGSPAEIRRNAAVQAAYLGARC